MSYQLRVLKDSPVAFWPLDESSGSIAYDVSGSGNNGTYTGSITTDIMPIVAGGISGTKITSSDYVSLPITKNYYGATETHSFGTKYSFDKAFTLEIWFKEDISSANKNIIFADESNNIGLFWQNGNIIFALDSEEIEYTCLDTGSAKHIVCVYNINSASLYVDGYLVGNISLSDFAFTNSSIDLMIGPAESGDIFYVDAPAVYRNALTQQQIMMHYSQSGLIPPEQIVFDKNGEVFICTDYNMRKNLIKTYPFDKPWNTFYDEDLYYDLNLNYVEIAKTETQESKTVILEDFIVLSNLDNLISSKIEWLSTKGITIETSIDGIAFEECINGRSIPQFIQGTSSFSDADVLYIRITLTTTDASRYVPRLYWINLYMYSDKKLYSSNGASFILSEEDDTTWDYDIASSYFSPLIRSDKNGIIQGNSGFYIDANKTISTVEMIFTPDNVTNDNSFDLLYFSPSIYYRFGSAAPSGVSIFVNGVDRSTATNPQTFLNQNEPHHIVISISSDMTGKIYIGKGAGTDRHGYQNIAIYESVLSLSDAQENYNNYIGRPGATVSESAISMTETSSEYYNYNWTLIKST
jgi:hypothetical protein